MGSQALGLPSPQQQLEIVVHYSTYYLILHFWKIELRKSDTSI